MDKQKELEFGWAAVSTEQLGAANSIPTVARVNERLRTAQ